MARTYAKLLLDTWDAESDFAGLSRDAQWLYWVLLSHPMTSSAGVLPLQPRKWARRASDATPETVAKALADLVADVKIIVDDDTEEVLIRTFVRHDGGANNPNLHKGIIAAIGGIESDLLRRHARWQLALARGENPQGTDPDEDPSERSPERSDTDPPEASSERGTERHPLVLTTPTPTPTPLTDPTPLPEPLSLVIEAHDEDAPTFDQFWQHYPRKVSKADTRKLWDKLTATDKRAAVTAIPCHSRAWASERPPRPIEKVMHPDRWLRGRHWEDQFGTPSDDIDGVYDPDTGAWIQPQTARQNRR